METSMYDTLLQLPLFQGLCKDDFTTIIEKVKFHFQDFKQGESIVKQGTSCNPLIFLLNGKITLKVVDSLNGYTFHEIIPAPHVIEPYSLFGMSTSYTGTYLAETDVKVLTIDKSFLYDELNHYEIFRLNYLNILSNRIQIAHQKLWSTHLQTLEEKFYRFLSDRSLRPQAEITLQITMEDLARLIHETRINVSRMLNNLQAQGLIQLKRKEMYIPALDKLAKSLI